MALCENCANYKQHKEKCWFYWENKKQCSQFKKDHNSEPEFMEEE